MTGSPSTSLRRLTALGAAALLLLLMAAAPAGAATPREFFGVHSPEGSSSELDADFARIGGAKVGTIRLNLDWRRVQPIKDGPYDWSTYDDLMARGAAAGVNYIAVVAGPPAWASSSYSSPPMTSEARAGFAAFAREAAKRYGPNGDYWALHAATNPYGPAARPIRSWQIWNEPNLPSWWNGRPNARSYASLVRLIAPVIKQTPGNSRARIVLAGIPEARYGVKMADFITQLYRVRGFKNYFDHVAIHPYATDYRGVVGAVQRVRAVMNRYGDARTYIWITESGWATRDDLPSTKWTSWTTTHSRQASHLRATFSKLASYRSRYRIRGIVWFNWRDQPTTGDDDWWARHCGLLRADGRAKSAWYAFRRFSQATR